MSLTTYFTFQLDCKAAFKRFEEGIPGAATAVDDSAKTIAETVQFFITAMVRESQNDRCLLSLISKTHLFRIR